MLLEHGRPEQPGLRCCWRHGAARAVSSGEFALSLWCGSWQGELGAGMGYGWEGGLFGVVETPRWQGCGAG